MPNTDTKNYKIISLIKTFVQKNKNSYFFKYLGKQKYFSIIKNFDCVIGNSSSGISEVPSLKIPTINIGTRQKGRIMASSVINIKRLSIKSLDNAIKKIETVKFNKALLKSKNPYYKNNTTKNIIKILERVKFENINYKKFVDLKLKR